MFISVPDRIRIRPKVSDSYGSSFGSGSATLFLNQKLIWDVHPGSWILALEFLPSRIWIPYPGVGKTPDPGSGSATLLLNVHLHQSSKIKSKKEVKN
jgi:hypothetical protein